MSSPKNQKTAKADFENPQWIGTSGYQYPEWKGKFYPETMPAAKMLAFYAEHFFTTETNSSFAGFPVRKRSKDG